jgi:hypothetical protein
VHTNVHDYRRGAMPKPTIAIASVTPDEAEHLRSLRKSVRRVHKSLPMHAPARQASTDLSARLSQLHRRGVPLHTLADVVGLSHQAVRVRVRFADDASHADPQSVAKAPTLAAPPTGAALITDAGVHRRLHIYDPPSEVGRALLELMGEVPFLKSRGAVVDWLESETGGSLPADAPPTTTKLRTPPSVYVPRGMLESVLIPLTNGEEE